MCQYIDLIFLVLTSAGLSVFLPILRIANIRANKGTHAREAKVKMGLESILTHAGLKRTQGKTGMREVIAQG